MLKAFKRRRQANQAGVDELLSAYLDGMLTPAEQAMLEARLEGEPALQEQLEGLRRTVEALAALSEMDVPRNFILSPSMVAAPRPPVLPRRRRTSPIFGWATAVATLLLLFVLAGDFFVIAPSLRPEPTDTIAREPQLLGQERGELDMQDVVQALGVESVVVEGVVPEAEKAVAPATEVPAEKVEAEVAPTAEAQLSVAEAEPPAPAEAVPAAEAADELFQTEVPPAPPGEVPMGVTQEPAEFQEVTPLGGEVTATAVAEAKVDVTPAPPVPEPGKEVPMAASPPPERGTADMQEQEATPPLEPVALAPLEEMAPAAGTEEAAEGVPLWLRLVEIGLGLVVVGLAATTLILRRRGA